jgi:hypothetical protein
VAHESNVERLTMMAVDMIEFQVSPSQGVEWYQSVRSRGVPTNRLADFVLRIAAEDQFVFRLIFSKYHIMSMYAKGNIYKPLSRQ